MDRTRGIAGISLALTCFAVSLVGCSTFRVSTDYDPQTDFQQLQGYSWLATVRQPGDDPRLHNSLVDARVRAAVDRELAAKGYSKAGGSSGNFVVTYYLGLQDKIDVRTIHTGYGYGYGSWYHGTGRETMVDQYEEGTLLLDILDAEGGDLLWRGSASARVSESSSPEEREKRIQDAVAAILAEFPPS